MIRNVRFWALFAVIGLLATATVFAEDKKDTPLRGRGALPPSWSKLGLTDEQKQQIYSIQVEYRTKIDDLRRQVRKLEKDERAQMEKVLTDAQRARLREMISEKYPGAGQKDESQPPKDKPSGENK